MVTDIKKLLNDNSVIMEKALKNAFELFSEKRKDAPTELLEAMEYATLGGGKRIRAFLVIQSALIFGGTVEKALPFACAVEMIHAYSLIHDDMPCMDNDDMRRGKPSCHKKFGETIALLAGDTLQSMAYETILSNKSVSDKSICLAVGMLARMSGYSGMCGGQELDIKEDVGTYDELKYLQSLKTGALIKASVLLGLYSATDTPEKEQIDSLMRYAGDIGLAFQIHDDILDVTSTEKELGKPIGSDKRNDKKTVLSFMSVSEARDEENRLTLDAVQSLSDYYGSEILSQLAVWLMTRKA